jgi:hypothetical protein
MKGNWRMLPVDNPELLEDELELDEEVPHPLLLPNDEEPKLLPVDDPELLPVDPELLPVDDPELLEEELEEPPSLQPLLRGVSGAGPPHGNGCVTLGPLVDEPWHAKHPVPGGLTPGRTAASPSPR